MFVYCESNSDADFAISRKRFREAFRCRHRNTISWECSILFFVVNSGVITHTYVRIIKSRACCVCLSLFRQFTFSYRISLATGSSSRDSKGKPQLKLVNRSRNSFTRKLFLFWPVKSSQVNNQVLESSR